MIINSNFQMNHRSIEEFARVMVPEALDKNLDIEIERESRDIVVRLEIDGRVEFFRYPDQNGKFEDQEITMTKILMLKFFGKKYSWGGLMGVRPTKVVRRLLALGYGYEEIKKIMEEFLLVSREKIELLIEVVKKELEFLDRKHINLYIGIPFCPTKCKYCSFASYEIGSGVGRYYNDFVKTLLDEIEVTGKFLREENFKISSLYIGGGTPSTLTEKDLEDVLKAVNTHIDMSDVREFTFEAGREDTLTDEKLEIAKKYGVDRISLNPQTFKVETLKKVNRKFDRENFEKYFRKAKELGFIVNMDIIVGLPDETTEDILYTLGELEKFDIENLTIHTLAFKRASNLFKESQDRVELDGKTITEAIKRLVEKKDIHPYYMYRQKNIMEWGENIGYSKLGCESVFNIEMIEENQSTMGLGGGAITKIVIPENEYRDYIERYVNPKDPALYIREMSERMEVLFVILLNFGIAYGNPFENNESFDIIMSDNVLDENSKYLDINTASKEEMSNFGVTTRLAGLIVEYREQTGGFKNLNELKRIKGIGQATFDKLRKKLMIKTQIEKKPLYINEANDTLLEYYGFDKKEIKDIRKYLNKNGRINSNLDLMKVLSEKNYRKYKSIIKYDKF